jgi:hypothetical protein
VRGDAERVRLRAVTGDEITVYINLARRTRFLHSGPDNHQRGWIRRASLLAAAHLRGGATEPELFNSYPTRVPVWSAAMPPVRLLYSTPSKPSARINSARRF